MNSARNKKRRLRFIAAFIPAAILLAILNYLAEQDLPRIRAGGEILSEDFVAAKESELKWTFEPGRNNEMHSVYQVRISTNEQGFRTNPFKPKGSLPRIVLLGDSIAFGVYLDDEQRLSGQIEKKLAARGTPAEVFDLGVPAYAMRQYAAAYRFFGADLQPDVVILQTEPGDFRDPRFFALNGLENNVALFAWLHWRLERRRPVDETQHIGIESYRTLLQECRAKNIPVLVLYFPFLVPDWRDADWRKTKAILDSASNTVLDVGEILSSTGREPATFRVRPNDVIHPNAEAVELVASAILPEIALGTAD